MHNGGGRVCERQGGRFPCDSVGSSLPVPLRAAPGRRCAPVAGPQPSLPPTVVHAPTPPSPARTAFLSSCTRPPSWGLCPTLAPLHCSLLPHQLVQHRHEPQVVNVLHAPALPWYAACNLPATALAHTPWKEPRTQNCSLRFSRLPDSFGNQLRPRSMLQLAHQRLSLYTGITPQPARHSSGPCEGG